MTSPRRDMRCEVLREAAALGDVDKVRIMTNSGLDVNSRNDVNGWTALHWACKRDHPAVVSLLLSSGANPKIRNHKDEMPVDIAGPRVAAETELFVASGRDAPDEDALAELEASSKRKRSFVPNFVRNPEFFYSSDPSAGFVQKPQPTHSLAPTAAAASSPARPSRHSTPPTPAGGGSSSSLGGLSAAAAAVGGGFGSGGGGGGNAALNAEVVAHLLRECADFRARIGELEAAQNARVDTDNECVDVHVAMPGGVKTARLIGVPNDTSLQDVLDAVPVPPSLTSKHKLMLYADAQQGLLLLTQTVGRLRRHLTPNAKRTDPLVLHLGLIPTAAHYQEHHDAAADGGH